MFRHRERFVRILIFVLVGAMVLSLTLGALSAIIGG
jgi:hypothetical protein